MSCSRLSFPMLVIAVTVLLVFLATVYLLEFHHPKAVTMPVKVIATPQPSPIEAIPVAPPVGKKPAAKAKPKPKPKPKQKPRTIEDALHSTKTKKKVRNKYWTPIVYEYQSDWGSHGELPHIAMMHTPKKIMIKKDRKVIFPNVTVSIPHWDGRDAAAAAKTALAAHFLSTSPAYRTAAYQLEDVLISLSQQKVCQHIPVFLTMATVGDELYWQLIENFIFTLIKFDLSSCAIIICVSDPHCMAMCASAGFPCYDYQSAVYPSVMEKIAMLKLEVIPRALLHGVDVFMLDLDVGFLASPEHILKVYRETPLVDIFVQEDYTFIMNRSIVGWKQWFTEPLPNIGAFLCRGNNRTYRVFEIALDKYLTMDLDEDKNNPGKDQNHVLDAMRIARGTLGLKYAYLTNNTAPLLDKLVLFNSNLYELGGTLMEGLLHERQSLLVHTTCYEKSTKVMGLKLTNAYWNPYYYMPNRRTLTKQLLYFSDQQLLDEVRSLLWLASLTKRALILPNILGADLGDRYKIVYRSQHMWPGFRVLYLKKPGERFNSMFGSSGAVSKNIPAYSPILEPGFYWRTQRDYGPIPAAAIVHHKSNSLLDVYNSLMEVDASPRVVLHGMKGSNMDEDSLRIWADDSIGLFPAPFKVMARSYLPLGSARDVKRSPATLAPGQRELAEDMLYGLRTCKNIFNPPAGNRTCFQICD